MISVEQYGYEAVRAEILQAEGSKAAGKKTRSCVSVVIGGLCLANDEKFAETLGLACRTKKGVVLDTSNPHCFEVIISLCSYTRITRAIPDLQVHALESVEEVLKGKKIAWLQMGRSLPDDVEAWTDLVFNATFPDSDLAKQELEIPRKSQLAEHMAFRALKKSAVLKLHVKEWFAHAFALLDAAVCGKKTLVHCHAGVSRSPALVAAYLINRYHVHADQAVAFLRTKRSLVKPKCIQQLHEYSEAVKHDN